MAHGVGRVIQDRYRVDRELGHRGHVSTWLVTDLRSAAPCVLKVLREADAPPADARLFEAQARVLAGLDHPGLPRFVEHFVVGEGAAREHCLITRFYPGESLQRLVAKGRLFTEAQAVALLRRIVPILSYLHGFDPPLVHRGIKATNIIVGPDRRPCLTDMHFAVEGEGWRAWEETPPEDADLALAAPEAVLGGAVPASDIYAVGMAMIYAMSGQDPAAVVRDGSRQRLREATRASEPFAALLARMVEPSLERRYPDVRALEADLARLAAGRGPAALPAQVAVVPQQPLAVAPAPPASAGLDRPRHGGSGSALRVAVLLLVLAGAAAAFWFSAARRGEHASESLLLPPPAAVAPIAPAPAPPPREAPAPAVAETPAAPGAPGAAEPQSAASAGLAAPAPDAAAPLPAAPASPVDPAPVQPSAPGSAPAPDAPAPAGEPLAVEGRLLFDGQPLASLTRLAPTFWFRDEAKGVAVKPQVEYRDGAFQVRGLPRGRMGMSMRVNLEPGNPNLYPGDLDAWTTFVVGDAPPAPLEVDLRKVIHLTQPVDNNVPIRGWDEPCGAGSVHPGRVVFAWEPLDAAAQYEATVDRLACGRNYASAGRAFSAKTAETWVRVELPPSAEGECYSFRLSARKDGRPIGMFTTHGRSGLGWDYRFTVK